MKLTQTHPKLERKPSRGWRARLLNIKSPPERGIIDAKKAHASEPKNIKAVVITTD